ncbi:MAG: hypothetical protein U1C33_06920, partial [Candidatus Cloacimonadaceae bacterium]|nr:hypothetical protein [Candidatus Cloacimonadaceae bacterium]
HHQTVDGYSAAKLKRYDDFLRTNLHPQFNRYKEVLERYAVEVPTPVHDMLSVKYFVVADTLALRGVMPQKNLVYTNPFSRIKIYENLSVLPRAWFVENVEVVPVADSILALMNGMEFDPERVAYIETPIEGLEAPRNASAKQSMAELHELRYDVKTDTKSLLVLSEVYYPAGWKAYLNDEEIEILPVNYILRGIAVPAGEHELKLVFAPESYGNSVKLSGIGLIMTLLCLAGGLAIYYKNKKQTITA